jgi:hypothetical protein
VYPRVLSPQLIWVAAETKPGSTICRSIVEEFGGFSDSFITIQPKAYDGVEAELEIATVKPDLVIILFDVDAFLSKAHDEKHIRDCLTEQQAKQHSMLEQITCSHGVFFAVIGVNLRESISVHFTKRDACWTVFGEYVNQTLVLNNDTDDVIRSLTATTLFNSIQLHCVKAGRELLTREFCGRHPGVLRSLINEKSTGVDMYRAMQDNFPSWVERSTWLSPILVPMECIFSQELYDMWTKHCGCKSLDEAYERLFNKHAVKRTHVTTDTGNTDNAAVLYLGYANVDSALDCLEEARSRFKKACILIFVNPFEMQDLTQPAKLHLVSIMRAFITLPLPSEGGWTLNDFHTALYTHIAYKQWRSAYMQ